MISHDLQITYSMFARTVTQNTENQVSIFFKHRHASCVIFQMKLSVNFRYGQCNLAASQLKFSILGLGYSLCGVDLLVSSCLLPGSLVSSHLPMTCQ